MRILLLDNYDSFTYNLVHYFEGLDCEVEVVRNDEISLDQIDAFDKVVLSPGPGLPLEANDLMAVVDYCLGRKPILGVCLGFQAIVEHLSGSIYNQQAVKHGISEEISIEGSPKLFLGLPQSFQVGLYHSWAAKKDSFPEELIVTSLSENDIIMSFEHTSLPVCGVQFHPESILTENGQQIVQNFIEQFH